MRKINLYTQNQLADNIQQQQLIIKDQQMAILKRGIRGKTVKKVRHVASKKEKLIKRSARIQRVIQLKKKEKAIKKQRHVPYKKKKQAEAQNQLVEAAEPVFHQTATNEQLNILNLLNLGNVVSNDSNFMNTLQQNLETKLKELDQDNLENPEVRRVYTEIGKIFSTYRSGKIPKAFKIIPNLVKWKQIIQITKPSEWTPQAMYQTVNIFASNFDPVRARIFFSDYLLPAVKEDLKKNKKLNFHYFESLRKALYKPNAWFKAILFEFCNESATSKEVMIIESLIKQMSIPCLNSAVAMIKLTELPYCSSVIHFLKALIEKKYSLPKKVVDTLYNYFLGFSNYESELPVVWHQALFSFCKQYIKSLDEMNKSALQKLVQKQKHHLIGPQIIKVLI